MIPLNEKIRILSRLMIDVIENTNLHKAGITNINQNQFMILKILAATGPKKVREIAEYQDLSNAAVSKNIDYLMAQKLVYRKIISTNRRAVSVGLLKKGQKLIAEYQTISEKNIKTILAAFSKEEKTHLGGLLDKYIARCIEMAEQLRVFCIQCGGKYEGDCPVGKQQQKCYFQMDTTESIPDFRNR